MAQRLTAQESEGDEVNRQQSPLLTDQKPAESDDDWVQVEAEWKKIEENTRDLAETMKSIEILESAENELVVQLDDLDRIWQQKRDAISEQLELVQAEKIPHLRAKERQEQAQVKRIGATNLTFLETSLWNDMCCAVVAVNILLMVWLDSKIPSLLAFWLDQIILAWYVIELSLGLYHFRTAFFIGPLSRVLFGWLDTIIVISGIVDQWLSPLVMMLMNSGHGSSSSWVQYLRYLRLFRLIRLLKLVKSFLLHDSTWLLESDNFQIAMSLVIAANSVVMAVELDVKWDGWVFVDNMFMACYFVEVALKLKTWSWHFFVDKQQWVWNWLDFTIVSTGVFDSWLMPCVRVFKQEVLGEVATKRSSNVSRFSSLLRLARLLRVLRLVRLLRTIPALFKLLNGVMFALGAMKWVICITLIMLYGSAIMFTNLVGRGIIYGPGAKPPPEADALFGTVPASLFTLFQLMNGNESVVEPITSNVFGKLLFVGFTIIANWAILAILTSVVSDNMISASAKFAKEQEEQEYAQDAQRSQRRLLRIFERTDADGDGVVDEEEWAKLLSHDEMLNEMQDASGMEATELQDLFSCMVEDKLHRNPAAFKNGHRPQIDYRSFVSHLEDHHTPADRRSVLMLMMRLRCVEQKLEDGITDILRGLGSTKGRTTRLMERSQDKDLVPL